MTASATVLKAEHETPGPAGAAAAPNAHITGFGDRAGRLGLEIADIAGTVDDLHALNKKLLGTLECVVVSAEETTDTNSMIATAMEDARGSAESTRTILRESSDRVAATLTDSISKMQALSEGVFGFSDSLGRVRGTISKVQEASASIQAISLETQIISINAGVEAARAGDAGRGFAVISKAIRSLADQVRKFSDENARSLSVLQSTLDELMAAARGNTETAQSALASSREATGTARQIQSLVASVEHLTEKIETMSDPVQRNIESGSKVRDCLDNLAAVVDKSNGCLAATRTRAESILGISEDLMLFVAQSGHETADTPVIAIARLKAAEIAGVFERAVEAGEISLADFFDERYRDVKGSNPAQFLTRFTAFTDRVLPALQEPVLEMHDRIVFCAAIDRNGYLPTHNNKYSQRQGPDPAWNAANCRNHRIFNDRTGLGAGRNTRPFLLQTYRRDMGNGSFILMKDVSAPITVRGRHWGGFRIGFKA